MFKERKYFLTTLWSFSLVQKFSKYKRICVGNFAKEFVKFLETLTHALLVWIIQKLRQKFSDFWIACKNYKEFDSRYQPTQPLEFKFIKVMRRKTYQLRINLSLSKFDGSIKCLIKFFHPKYKRFKAKLCLQFWIASLQHHL